MNDKLNFKIEDNKLKLGLDANKDGKNSLELTLDLSEAIKEALSKGASVEGVKTATVKFEGTKLVVTVDTDKDGVALLTLEADLFEAIEETGLLK